MPRFRSLRLTLVALALIAGCDSEPTVTREVTNSPIDEPVTPPEDANTQGGPIEKIPMH